MLLINKVPEYIYLDGIPVAVTDKQGMSFVQSDHLGTPRLVSNTSQTVVWRWDGDAFGATAANEDPDGDAKEFVFNQRFPGQYLDKESKLHYNYFRDYDSSLGRYVESDPIGQLGGLNLYSYVQNLPISIVDYHGMKPSCSTKYVPSYSFRSDTRTSASDPVLDFWFFDGVETVKNQRLRKVVCEYSFNVTTFNDLYRRIDFVEIETCIDCSRETKKIVSINKGEEELVSSNPVTEKIEFDTILYTLMKNGPQNIRAQNYCRPISSY